ncbi:response regulator [bacterium LRH843]|nr:response regulator [bacterium LRH843]
MLNVLLADDELIVRKGLRALINWDEYGMDVIQEATNGKQAMDLLDEYDIDLVITDIRMPLVDGIELTRKVKEQSPHIKVILLTCYNDFEYVREALELGASGYLLKTDLEDGSLEKLLQKISMEIKQERAIQKNFKELERKANQSLSLLREKGIKSLIKGGMIDQTAKEKLSFLHAPHIVIKVMFKETGFPAANVEKTFHSLFHQEKSMVFQMEDRTMLALLTLEHDTEQTIVQWYEEIKKNSNSVNLYYLTCEHLDSLQKQYNIVTGLSNNHRYYEGYGFLVNIGRFPMNFITETYDINLKPLNELIIIRDWRKIKELCDSLFKSIKAEKVDVEIVKLNVIQMVETIMFGLHSNSNLFTPNWGSNSLEVKEKIKEIDTFQDVVNWFYSGIDHLEESRLLFIGGANQVVKRAVMFIENNYFKEITLEELSDEVGLSKSYLSTMFKKVTGKNVIEYLNDVRIEQAKQLFLKSDLKIFEVAEKVGFNDPKYFSKQFKRIAGVSPNQFRNEEDDVI